MPELSDEAKAEIEAAVKIVASDKGYRLTKAMHDKLIPPTPENDPPKEGEPVPPPAKEPAEGEPEPKKKAGLWWGDRLED